VGLHRGDGGHLVQVSNSCWPGQGLCCVICTGTGVLMATNRYLKKAAAARRVRQGATERQCHACRVRIDPNELGLTRTRPLTPRTLASASPSTPSAAAAVGRCTTAARSASAGTGRLGATGCGAGTALHRRSLEAPLWVAKKCCSAWRSGRGERARPARWHFMIRFGLHEPWSFPSHSTLTVVAAVSRGGASDTAEYTRRSRGEAATLRCSRSPTASCSGSNQAPVPV
jgi:hypothetical protein